MSWANYGKGGWHFDHIRPARSFDLTNFEQQNACFHYTNFQPLWEFDNISKNDKMPDGTRARDVYTKENELLLQEIAI